MDLCQSFPATAAAGIASFSHLPADLLFRCGLSRPPGLLSSFSERNERKARKRSPAERRRRGEGASPAWTERRGEVRVQGKGKRGMGRKKEIKK